MNVMKPVLVATAMAGVFLASVPLQSMGQQQTRDFRMPTTNPRATVTQWIASTKVEVDYHRPRVRGRQIFGALVPWGQVWRTGSDNATRISFSTPITLNGVELGAGTYELFTIPGESEWTIIVHADQSQWGSYSYDPDNDVARFTVRPERLDAPAESFTIGFDEVGTSSANLHIDWERTRVPIRLEVDVEATVVPRMEELLRTSERPPYFLAAMFYFENGLDLERASELMELALEQAPGHIGMLHRHALILAAKGDTTRAIAVAEESLAGARGAAPELREEYTRLNNALLERLRGGASDFPIGTLGSPIQHQ